MTETSSLSESVEVMDAVGFWSDFLFKNYQSEITRVSRMWPDDKRLIIKFGDIVAAGSPGLYYSDELIRNPASVLKDIRDAIELKKVVKKKGEPLPAGVKVTGLLLKTPVRYLRGSSHVGMFIAVEGVIKRVSSRKERLVTGVFKCAKGHRTVKRQPHAIKEVPSECQADGCRSKPVELLPDFSEFVDTQTAILQEYMENLSPGEQPQTIEISLNEDLIDTISAGNRVIINGILRRYQTSSGKASTIYKNYVEVNSVEVTEKEYSELVITDEEIAQITELSKDPEIYSRLANSIVPSIYGLEDVKLAVVYQFFGGSKTESSKGVETRGDIHIFLIGEPGIAKTDLLRKIVKYSPRGIFTSGKGSSGVGLTVSVVKGEAGEDAWVCEPGALALADGGVCVIDEINQIDDKEYSMLYEAMEIQQVSINKATIHQTIYTRCSLLGAANPVDGWLDDNLPLKSQIEMPPALLSRFDLIFILKDDQNTERDEKIIRHIIGVRSGNAKSDKFAPDISEDLFRKYVAHAKQIGTLKWTKSGEDAVAKYYIFIRNGRADIADRPVPITPRQGNSLARLAEASARIRLSLKVEAQDVERGRIILDSCLRKIAYDAKNEVFDAGVMVMGKTKKQTTTQQALKSAIRLVANDKGVAKVSDVLSQFPGNDEEHDRIKIMLKSMIRGGEASEPRDGLVRLE